MTLEAAELLKKGEIDSTSKFILSFIVILDEYGARTWNLRVVGIVTTVILLLIRMALKKKGGVDWYALAHALVSGGGALACIYLDFYASETLTGTAEPLRSIQCHGAFTSLHRIVPAITMGYSLFDILDGLTIGVDFAMHGTATLLIMAYFCEHGLSHIITSMLLMECSTPFLTVVRATFFTPTMTAINMGLFVLSFFFFRILLVPYVWTVLMHTMVTKNGGCFPRGFTAICIAFGIFFHSLNAYWFIKLVKKARRKLLGIEKVTDANDLKDEGKKLSNGVKKD